MSRRPPRSKRLLAVLSNRSLCRDCLVGHLQRRGRAVLGDSTATSLLRAAGGLLAEGHGNREMAQALGVSERNVKGHLTRLMMRFQVPSRTQLAVLAGRAGLRAPPPHRTALAVG